MILALLFSLAAMAGDLSRECTPQDPGLQRFFSEYVEAHAKAEKKTLKKLFTADFWEQYSEFAPSKPSKKFLFKILRAVEKTGYCHVEWAATEASKKQAAPAWFRMELKERWKIDGISADAED